MEKIKILERELQNTKENLQATIEELETTNEELQSTNEELLAANEELQSTNEELHSVNEELYTVNSEYQNKIDELTQLTNDEENFLKSTNIGTIFLSPTFHVRKFTPAVAEAFNLLPQDIDRPISHITHNLDINLLDIIEKVAKTLESSDFEARSSDGKWYIGKAHPYKDDGESSGGVVLTFTDVTHIKEMEREKNEKEQVLRGVTEEVSDGWWDCDLLDEKRTSHYMSPKLKNILGYEDYEVPNTGEGRRMLMSQKEFEKFDHLIEECKKDESSFDVTLNYMNKEGLEVPFRCRGKVLRRGRNPYRVIGVQNKISQMH